MILLLDVGNTRIKWATLYDGSWQQQGSGVVSKIADLIQQWQGLAIPSRIIGCSVVEQHVMHQLETHAFARFTRKIAWLAVTPERCGVTNRYSNIGTPDQYVCTLGPDRWAGLIAAHYHYPGHTVVVDVGTAVTVDALTADGVFLGGMIIPGIRLMQEGLYSHTARLPYTDGQYHSFPSTTADAIHTGIVTALTSAVDTMAARLAEYTGTADIQCVISGGDADRISPYLRHRYQLVDELVLRGLAVIALQEAEFRAHDAAKI